jgi:hypothetical protein
VLRLCGEKDFSEEVKAAKAKVTQSAVTGDLTLSRLGGAKVEP